MAAVRSEVHDQVVAGVLQWASDSGAVAVTRWTHRPGVVVVCVLLPSGVEVDFGVWSTGLLFAPRPDWKLVNAAHENAARTVRHALPTNPPLERTHEPFPAGDDPAWQGIVATIVECRRESRPVDIREFDRTLQDVDYSDSLRSLLRELSRDAAT